MTELTPSKENYIKTIYKLNPNGQDGVQSLDVAVALGVSKPSVSRAVKELQQKNLVERTENLQVRLTSEGRRRAVVIDLRFYAVKYLLTEMLGVDEETAVIDASFLEHIISPESLSCIIKYINNTTQGKMFPNYYTKEVISNER